VLEVVFTRIVTDHTTKLRYRPTRITISARLVKPSTTSATIALGWYLVPPLVVYRHSSIGRIAKSDENDNDIYTRTLITASLSVPYGIIN